MKRPASPQPERTEEQRLVADCIRHRAVAKNKDLEAYLRGRGIADTDIPGIIAQTLKAEQAVKAAKTRMQEGGVITTLGLGGVAYATATEKDGTVWLLWSMVGLGIWANGWWKRKKVKQYY